MPSWDPLTSFYLTVFFHILFAELKPKGGKTMQNKCRFLWQALLLTGVSMLLRSVGVSAQVIIASKIGAEAVGVSSLISGVGGFAITLALSGIQLGCTRLVSEALGMKNTPLVHRTLRCAIAHALAFGCLSCIILLLGAPLIGRFWLRDIRTLPSLRILALTLPFISLASCFSGYFVAVRRVYKSAGIQVIEEILRIGCTLFLLNRMVSKGLESALLALALSSAIADISSGCVLYVLYRHDRRRHFPTVIAAKASPSYASVGRKLLSITMPVAIATYARSGLITLEHMLIPIGLQQFGHSHGDALAAYGIVHSMALPVVLFPTALLGAFAGLLIPEITEAHVRGEYTQIRGMMGRVFSLTLLYAIGTSGIIIAFSYELGSFLYHSWEAAECIRLLAPLIPIMYLDSATDAMLKGLGEQIYSMKVNIIDASVSVLLVWILIPSLGVMGYIITIYVTELLNAALSIVRLLNISKLTPHVIKWVAKPLLSIVGATCITRLLYTLIPAVLTPPEHILALVFLICVALFLYAILLFITGGIQKRDVVWLRSFLYSDKECRLSLK